MAEMFTVKVEEATPAGGGRLAAGPVYRSVYAKDGLMELPQDIQSPWDFFSGAVKKYPKNMMLGQRQVTDGKAGEYVWQTYEEVYQKVMRIGSAIRSFSVNPGAHCGIYGSNCPEWVMAMQACNSQGICYVPLYDTLGANAVEFIMDHAEISIAFVQESKIKSILAVVPKCTAHLRAIVSFGDFTSEMKKEAEKFGVSCFSWEDFSSMITEEDSYFSYLPLAHIFDQVIENYCISKGASIGFWQGDIRYLMEDVQVMKPTIFCGVPRVYDRIYTGINLKIESGGMLAKHLFQYAYNYKLANMRKGLKQHEASPFFDKIVFSKIKEGLGGRIRLMIAGAAPLAGQIEEFLRVTSCSVFVQGYGLTESCAGCFTSIANVVSMIGTVGPPVTTIEARLESVPEMGYDALSETPRGEICLRGHTLFSGYYKRPSLTEEVFSDGWFHTGDIGEWQPNGAMKIIDRKKNIFKLSQGEYVAVEVVESAYMQSPLVASVWVYGNSFESFLVAVVVPERQALEEWAATNNKAGDFAELCNDPKARGYIQDELNKTGKKLGLRGFEMLKAVHLEPVPFSIEKDLITPTFKLKRPQLLKYYKDRVDQMYNDAKDGRTAL
ncbi:long chain acyl-CoA synthetase 2-like isoform X2 [Panicum virgatum]|uniref:long chain acyl-CoA synthetase 2-like isoform X2 n=1 Tax=Panicum virgatum TaxID=38727 RepID=UPI0019D541D1|nr:long chain acyl-CoA synthetase 2-like isoform X2 [Panicum virgatum]